MNILNLDVLKEPNALIIFISQLIISVTDKILSIGLIWYVTKNLGAEVVPWFLTFAFLPHLIFSLFSARVINYLGELKTIIYSEYFRSFVLIIYFLILHFKMLNTDEFKISLFVMIFLIGIGASLFTPAILSIPPKLVKEENIIGLNALIDTTMSISSIFGAVVSIFLLSVVDLKSLILINGITYFIAPLLQFKIKSIKNKELNSIESNSNSIISALKKYPSIAKMLFSFLFFNLALTPIFVLVPWYVEKIYHGNSSSLATIEGGMGLGAFLMGVFVTLAKIEINEKLRVKMIAMICFIFGLLFVLFSISINIWQGVLILFCIGAASTFLNIQILTYFQLEASSVDVPAIMTGVNLISAASIPISLTVSGIVLPYVHVTKFAAMCGIIVLFLSFAMPQLLNEKISKEE